MKRLIYCVTVVLGLATVMLLLPPPSSVNAGGGCNTCYQPSYVAPQVEYVDRVVAIAVPYTVAVPVISYMWNGGYGLPGYSPVYQAQPAAPMGQVQVPQPQTNLDNGAPKTSAMLHLSDADVDLLIDRIEKRLAERATNRNGSQSKSTKPTNSPPPSVPQDSPRSSTDTEVIQILSLKRGLTQKSCMDCHTGASSKGNMVIFDSPGVLSANANWAKIWDAADSGRMPKEASDNNNALLSDAECEILRNKMVKSSSGGR